MQNEGLALVQEAGGFALNDSAGETVAEGFYCHREASGSRAYDEDVDFDGCLLRIAHLVY